MQDLERQQYLEQIDIAHRQLAETQMAMNIQTQQIEANRQAAIDAAVSAAVASREQEVAALTDQVRNRDERLAQIAALAQG